MPAGLLSSTGRKILRPCVALAQTDGFNNPVFVVQHAHEVKPIGQIGDVIPAAGIGVEGFHAFAEYVGHIHLFHERIFCEVEIAGRGVGEDPQVSFFSFRDGGDGAYADVEVNGGDGHVAACVQYVAEVHAHLATARHHVGQYMHVQDGGVAGYKC